jgi:hypothetical protein
VDRVKGEVRKLGGKILKEDYTSDAAITCKIPRDKAPEFKEQLKEWGSGAISVSDR